MTPKLELVIGDTNKPLKFNSAADCPIAFKFVKMVQCVRTAGLVIKLETTGTMGGLKWQCGDNCHLFYFLLHPVVA